MKKLFVLIIFLFIVIFNPTNVYANYNQYNIATKKLATKSSPIAQIFLDEENGGSYNNEVVSITPANNLREVPLNSKITITFKNEPTENDINFINVYKFRSRKLSDIQNQIVVNQTDPVDIKGDIVISGNTVTFTPINPFEKGDKVVVSIGETIDCLSNIGAYCPSSKIQTFQFYADSYEEGVIGKSVKGRDIKIQKIGTGEKIIFIAGTIHGNEKIMGSMLNKYRKYLRSNINELPLNKTILFVNSINPDASVSNSRYNAHGIDLNRNFPTKNWKKDSYTGSFLCKGCGGKTPLSEPETIAVANIIKKAKPYMVLSYHTAGNCTIADQRRAYSVELAKIYSSKSRLPYAKNGWTAYPITGDMIDWTSSKLGINSITIEGASNTDMQYLRHQYALNAIIKK